MSKASRDLSDEIARRIEQAKTTGQLDLSKLRLAEVPSEVFQLTNLRSLSLSQNHLTSIPPELGRLANLQKLRIIDSRLTSLPPELGQLTNLQKLDLHWNSLTSAPPELGQLINLQWLQLSGNHLKSVPPELGQLENLQWLDLSGNQLTSLPTELGQLRSLQSLNLFKNPVAFPPPEIVEQGTWAILTFLREFLQGKGRQWVSKLLVVGEGGVGKTNVLRLLRGLAFDAELSTTHGIEIESVELPYPTEPDVTMRLNAWDFGGQEIYHATHQFFLTNRSLFLLLWNARHGYEQGKLYYWLDSIQAKAPESPVIIVATHTDERDADIPIREIIQKYPQIKGHYSISNKTGVGIEELRAALTVEAANLPLMGEPWPANWLAAAQEIRRNPDKHITPAELYQCLTDHHVEQSSHKTLAQWLHDLGDILYFQDDPELDDLVILKPQWVTRYISRVLESEAVIEGLGILTRDLMEKLWSDLDVHMRDHFLRLMECFDLSYRTTENPEISIIVERLRHDPPDYETRWNAKQGEPGNKEVCIKYEINSTTPAGVPTYFIARSHRFTTRTHWRTGALFQHNVDGENLGLIRAYPHERYLTLSARGPMPHVFFAVLREGLELTLDRFPGLPIKRKIPCPGHEGQPCNYLFDLEALERAYSKNPPVEKVQCQETFIDVSVAELMFGIRPRTSQSMEQAIVQKLDENLRRGAQTEEELRSLKELAQYEFTRQFRLEQSKPESYCPSTFLLYPESGKPLRDLAAGQKLKLHLYCQTPGHWHPAGKTGEYTIKRMPEWIETVSPILQRITKILKHAAPIAGVASSVAFPSLPGDFKDKVKLMEELVETIPDIKKSRKQDIAEHIDEIGWHDRIGGASLRALRELLDQVDPNHVWGGLRRILTPEGDYLWLCEHHAKPFLPPEPKKK